MTRFTESPRGRSSALHRGTASSSRRRSADRDRVTTLVTQSMLHPRVRFLPAVPLPQTTRSCKSRSRAPREGRRGRTGCENPRDSCLHMRPVGVDVIRAVARWVVLERLDRHQPILDSSSSRQFSKRLGSVPANSSPFQRLRANSTRLSESVGKLSTPSNSGMLRKQPSSPKVRP